MTTSEFVIVYVVLPLAITVGWLAWRARYFLRNVLIYSVAVAALLLVLRVGHMAVSAWHSMSQAVTPTPTYPLCITPAGRTGSGPGGQCWT